LVSTPPSSDESDWLRCSSVFIQCSFSIS
jgi:hypothetical protein